MNQATFLETRQRFSPTSLTLIIALHAAAITAAIAWKVEREPHRRPITDVEFYPVPKDPAPIPDTPDPRQLPIKKEVPIPPVKEDYTKLIQDGPGTTEVLTQTGSIGLPPIGPIDPPSSQSARATGDVRKLITPDDYPEGARRREETGTVQARLQIGANGSVTGCSIVASSGSAALDATTCRVLKDRARFTPAKDSSGQPVSDSYVTPRIVWRIEGRG